MAVGMAANPQEAHQVGRHRVRPPIENVTGASCRARPSRDGRTGPARLGGAGAAGQAGGFQMITFFEGSSPGALAILP